MLVDTDEGVSLPFEFDAVEDRVSVPDWHATMLHL